MKCLQCQNEMEEGTFQISSTLAGMLASGIGFGLAKQYLEFRGEKGKITVQTYYDTPKHGHYCPECNVALLTPEKS